MNQNIINKEDCEQQTEIYCWGSNSQGQLGLGENEIDQSFTLPKITTYNLIVKQISCGEDHSALITNEGLIYTFGSNQYGKLGIGNQNLSIQSTPVLVSRLQYSKCIKIACGWHHNIAVMDNGEGYSWGLGDSGQLGLGQFNNQSLPAKIFFQEKQYQAIVNCSAGSRHTTLIIENGMALTCGANESGQLGIGNRQKQVYPSPIPSIDRIIDASCGTAHTLFLTQTGQVYASGSNKFGQLGQGNKQNSLFPLLVKQLEREFIRKIACGHHSAALTEKGDLYIWGTGSFGCYLTPFNFFSTKGKVINFDIGSMSGVAVDDNGLLWSWGNNSSGELGVGDTESRNIPYLISSIQGTSIKKISCGVNFVIALGKEVVLNNNLITDPITQQSQQQFLSNSSQQPQYQNNQQLEQIQSLKNSLYLKNQYSPTHKIKPNGRVNSVTHAPHKQSIFSSQSNTNQNARELNYISQGGPDYSTKSTQNIFFRSPTNNDFISPNPTIDVVMQENKYMDNTLKIEREERQRLDRQNRELRLKLKDLTDGLGGIQDLEEKLEAKTKDNLNLKETIEQLQDQLKLNISENKEERQKNINLQNKLNDTEERVFNTENQMQDLLIQLERKQKELESLKINLNDQFEYTLIKNKGDKEEIEYLHKAIQSLEENLIIEKENRKKSENIKNHERKELSLLGKIINYNQKFYLNLEQERAILENNLQEFSRKLSTAMLALENEINSKRKVEDALQLQTQRVISFEEQNSELLNQVYQLRQLVYQDLEKNGSKNNLEVDTLIQVNKQLTKENRNLLKKIDDKHQDNQDLKVKVNQLLTQLQELEHHQYRILERQQQQQQNEKQVNQPRQNQLFFSQNDSPNTNKVITQLLESAHKHAKHMTRIIKNAKDMEQNEMDNNSFSNTPLKIVDQELLQQKSRQSPNLLNKQQDQRYSPYNKASQIPNYQQQLTESDKKLREALDLQNYQENKKQSLPQVHNNDSDDSDDYQGQSQGPQFNKSLKDLIRINKERSKLKQKSPQKHEQVQSLSDIKARLEKLQKDKFKLESRMSEFEKSVKKIK